METSTLAATFGPTECFSLLLGSLRKGVFSWTSRINGVKYHGTMASTQNAKDAIFWFAHKIPFKKKRLLLVRFEAVDYTLSNPSVVSGSSWVFDISTKNLRLFPYQCASAKGSMVISETIRTASSQRFLVLPWAPRRNKMAEFWSRCSSICTGKKIFGSWKSLIAPQKNQDGYPLGN